MEQKTDFVQDSVGKDFGQQQTIMIMLLSEVFNEICIRVQQPCIWSSVIELCRSQGGCCAESEQSSFNAIQKLLSTRVHIFVVVFPLHLSSAGYIQMQILVPGYGKIRKCYEYVEDYLCFQIRTFAYIQKPKTYIFTLFSCQKVKSMIPAISDPSWQIFQSSY